MQPEGKLTTGSQTAKVDGRAPRKKAQCCWKKATRCCRCLRLRAPPIVEAVQRVQPGDQDEVQALACTLVALSSIEGLQKAHRQASIV